MDPTTIRTVVAACREIAHASCNLAAVAAHAARDLDGGASPASAHAVEASITSAAAAFQLDDIYRRQNGSLPSVTAAENALTAAEEAIRAAKESIAYAKARHHATIEPQPALHAPQAR